MRLRETYQEVQETSDALSKLNLKLEDQVRDRTKSFKSAAAKAQNHAHERAQFIAAASHDLRQPLHALTMFNLALKRRSKDPNISDLLEKQEKSISNLGSLLQDTLDTAKIDSINRVPELSNVDVPVLLQKTAGGFDIQAEDRGITIHRNISSGHIVTDPAMLQRILSNLIDNALKAAMSRVDISAKIEDSGWVFSIKDDGRGIAASDAIRIFKSYISLHDKEPNEHGGYGLGLYVVNEFTKQLDGNVKIESTSTEGSIFVVRFPDSLGQELTKNGFNGVDEMNRPPDGLKVLAIDDELEILDAMEAMLTAWGCRIRTANGSSQALECVASGYHPDVLLVDYHLRRTNSLSIIDQLRNELGSNVSAIVITGATEPDILAKIKQSGYEVLAKPIDPHKLSSMLRALKH